MQITKQRYKKAHVKTFIYEDKSVSSAYDNRKYYIYHT